LDGNLRPDEEAEVAELLRSDPKARAYFREIAEQAVTVVDIERAEKGRYSEMGARRDWAGDRREPSRRTESMSVRPNQWRWAVTVAAIITLLAVIIFSVQTKSELEIARVVDLNGSLQWTGDGGRVTLDLEVGKSLKAGMMETLSPDAWVVLAFHDGSRVTLSGQSALTIATAEQNEMHLREGSLSAEVLTQSSDKPLLIHTPTAMLEVLGTQLNVEAASASTHLYVNEGTVRMTRLVDGNVADVPAEYHVVASLSHKDALNPIRRKAPVNFWKSRLQHSSEYVKGKWLPPSGEMDARLRAIPILMKKSEKVEKIWSQLQAMVKAGKMTTEGANAKMVAIKKQTTAHKIKADNYYYPAEMHLLLFSVLTGESPPVILEARSMFHIRGRTKFVEELHFGITTQYSKGGFAGKFEAVKPAGISDDPKGWFDIELSLHDFKSNQPELFPSPNGLEIKEFWIYVVKDEVYSEVVIKKIKEAVRTGELTVEGAKAKVRDKVKQAVLEITEVNLSPPERKH